MLHDIDKNGDNRLSPMPNTVDQQLQRMAHGTTEISLKIEGSEIAAKLTIKDGKLKIYKNDGSLLVQGGVRESDADGAFDMAKPGGALT